MLLPADTSVGWFHEAIQTASEVRFITAGRLAFINPLTEKPVSGNNKGSMLIIWHPTPVHTATLRPLIVESDGVRLKDSCPSGGCMTTTECIFLAAGFIFCVLMLADMGLVQ